MNIYIVVEGEVGERKVYECWIPLVNPNLTYVQGIQNIVHNNFAIIVGGGYPGYFDVIDAAITDVNSHMTVDRLVIAADSEEMEHEDKLQEIRSFVSRKRCIAEIHIIVQHFCLETWALGNRAVIRPQPRNPKLREYKRFYNVRTSDPELLPPYEPEELSNQWC